MIIVNITIIKLLCASLFIFTVLRGEKAGFEGDSHGME